jgi:hypothetical protein
MVHCWDGGRLRSETVEKESRYGKVRGGGEGKWFCMRIVPNYDVSPETWWKVYGKRK